MVALAGLDGAAGPTATKAAHRPNRNSAGSDGFIAPHMQDCQAEYFFTFKQSVQATGCYRIVADGLVPRVQKEETRLFMEVCLESDFCSY